MKLNHTSQMMQGSEEKVSCGQGLYPMLFSFKNKYYYTYPNTYIALYSRTPKLPVTHRHTHKNKKLLSIPLKLVPSLAKLPSLVTPFPLGGAPPTTNTSHSS